MVASEVQEAPLVLLDGMAAEGWRGHPWDCNAAVHAVEDRGLYDSAHVGGYSNVMGEVPQLAAAAQAVGDGAHAAAQVDVLPAAEPVTATTSAKALPPEAEELRALEQIAPGFAVAWWKEQQTAANQRRRYRLYRLGATMCIAITAIVCGQWALVHGADNQALYLSGAGLVSLLTTVMQHD